MTSDTHMEVTYRRSTRTDAEVVFNLVKASVLRLAPDPYPYEVVTSWLDGRTPQDYDQDCENGELWIGEIGGTPVGFAHGVPGEVKRLFVDANHVGKGAGAGLMQRALGDACNAWRGPIKIDATLNAVTFYNKWGFKEVGRSEFPGRDTSLPQIEVVVMAADFGELHKS